VHKLKYPSLLKNNIKLQKFLKKINRSIKNNKYILHLNLISLENKLSNLKEDPIKEVTANSFVSMIINSLPSKETALTGITSTVSYSQNQSP
jgi:hypothetical protein